MASPESEAKHGASSPSGGSTARLYLKLLLAAALVVAVDQVTKSLALDRLADGPVDLIEGAVTFNLAFNPGGVFGLGQNLTSVFLVATIVVIVGILFAVRRLADTRWVIPLGLVLGGGAGNLVDRLFRDHDGKVVDFIDLHVWPIFNLADSAIVIGVGVLLLLSFRTPRVEEEE
ncbi:MAG: signal peptidase II [Actinomycetota bacterium]|nr:signal peptidase II [Actinomycetota bacterium]